MSVLEVFLGIVSIAGTWGTFYYGFKASRLAREKYSFSWEDVLRGCRQLVRRGVEEFDPDVIVCFSGPSGVVANLIVELSRSFLPVYVVCIERREDAQNEGYQIAHYQQLETSKWRLYVPKVLLADTSMRVMLVDDVSLSGDSLFNLKAALIDEGFAPETILTCSLICSKVAHDANKAPDFAVYLLDTSEFYLPWGKGY